MFILIDIKVLLIAIGFDLVLGDPRWLIHPTQVMGLLIEKLESGLRKLAKTRQAEFAAGGMLVTIVVLSTYAASFLILWVCFKVHLWLGMLVAGWLMSTTIAIKGLAQAGLEIFHVLHKNDLLSARQKLKFIVGRDTDNLNRQEIVRATVETVAENIVDGIISPLCYAVLGGVPLALTYRAINTMDSMLGYKNDRYLYFGRAAARLDDVANYLPARITGLLLVLAAAICRLNWRKGLHCVITDAKKHPSPNSGIPEAAVAGFLGVSLGGVNYYGGIPSPRAVMGESIVELQPDHILATVRILYCTSALAVLLGMLRFI